MHLSNALVSGDRSWLLGSELNESGFRFVEATLTDKEEWRFGGEEDTDQDRDRPDPLKSER